jgi:4-amino-4-deoxy-L-arabinose transferase-like glycosyltransferase
VAIQIFQGFSAYYHRLAVIILLSGLLVRLVIALFLYPGFDEAYYYLYTLHPDWSYFDHPPLVGFTTGIGIWLTGIVSQLTMRLGTLFLYTLSLIFLYLSALQLYNLQIAINTLAIASAIPIFQVVFGMMNLPDTPLIFFWSLTLWLASQEFFAYRVYQPSYRLSLICLTVGLACLGKYHGFILGFGLLGFCLYSRQHRAALRSRWLWLGLPLFILAISPILVWNYQQDWVSFRFQSGRAVPNTGYHLDRLLVIFGVELLYLFPTFGLPLVWAMVRATIQQVRDFKWRSSLLSPSLNPDWELEKRAFILWLSLPLVLGFTLISGYQQILPGWKMPGYWTATILLGERIAISRRYRNLRTFYQWLIGSAIVTIVLMSIALSHVAEGTFQTPSKSAIFGLLPIKDDNSTQIFDIEQLRRGLGNNPKLDRAMKSADFVFTNRYYLGGQIVMAIEPVYHKPFTCLDPDLRGFAFWSTPQQWVGKNAIYLGTKTFDVDKDARSRYPGYFKKITKLGEIPIKRGGEVVQTFSVYQAQQMLKSFPRPYGNAVKIKNRTLSIHPSPRFIASTAD